MVPGVDVGGDELRQSATNCQTEGAGVRAIGWLRWEELIWMDLFFDR